MNIKISRNTVIIDGQEFKAISEVAKNQIKVDGNLYAKVEICTEKVGRDFIADYLGCSLANLSARPWFFPDFGKALKKCKEPYNKKEVIDWLSIPLKKRKEMYKKYINKESL